ncbi:hypothetical protein EsDP_00001551 [Epichloe bromicola]|uniref:Zn(2)-C6 fungal-type domain-containing protein n=1 Tax=Epichloe bromicola TaxID=79588 RepID=A0ABQ0CI74_9HYPO
MSSQSPAASEASDQPPAAVDRSCATCRRRKVRCDKKSPCTPCRRGRRACCYPPKEPRAPRVRKTTINDVATRISRLETTLTGVTTTWIRADHAAPPHSSAPPDRASTPASASSPHGGATAAASASASSSSRGPGRGAGSPPGEILLGKGSSSQYFNEVLVSRVIGQESDVRTALATPRDDSISQSNIPSAFNPIGILSSPVYSQPAASFHPPKSTAGQLWRIFVDVVDTLYKLVHIPTTEITVYTVINDPETAPAESLALCYAIYYAATVALDEQEDCVQVLGETWNSALLRYKAGLEQAFAQADLLENPTVVMLQAMAIYLSAVRVHNTGRGIWTLNGLAIRIAQSIGLHRDGKKLGLSPFESEIRRRLWWYLVGRDGRAAEDLGLHEFPTPNTATMLGGAELPLNLEDSDLYPEMKQLPPARRGWTRMLTVLVSIHITQTWADLSQLSRSTGPAPPSHEARDRIVGDLTNKVEDMMQGCNPVLPVHKMTMATCRFITRKLDFVTRQQWEAHHHPEQQELLATEQTLLEALVLFEEGENMLGDELLRPYHWSTRSYPQYHLMLFILWNICLQPRRACARRAFDAVEQHVRKMERASTAVMRGPKWTIFKALQARAATLIPQAAAQYQGNRNETDLGPTDGMLLGLPNRKLVEMSDVGMCDDMQHMYMPDWNTLLQGVLQEDFLDSGTEFTFGESLGSLDEHSTQGDELLAACYQSLIGISKRRHATSKLSILFDTWFDDNVNKVHAFVDRQVARALAATDARNMSAAEPMCTGSKRHVFLDEAAKQIRDPIPKGSRVSLDLSSHLNDKEVWGDDAYVFRPSRFEGRVAKWEVRALLGRPKDLSGTAAGHYPIG